MIDASISKFEIAFAFVRHHQYSFTYNTIDVAARGDFNRTAPLRPP